MLKNMDNWMLNLLLFCATNGLAQGSRAIRIYGEVTTVMNRKICGYITWGKNLYWTDIFLREKSETRICGIGILWEKTCVLVMVGGIPTGA